MAQYLFGAGVGWGTPLRDANGDAISNPTPVQLAVMQEISIDISWDTKMLHGQNQFPVAVGRGKGKLSGKAKAAQVNGHALNVLVFGQGNDSGLISDVYDTSGSTIPATPYQITVDPPNSGTFAYDLGVRDANGLPMTRVETPSGTGEYSVDEDTGEYTFDDSDTGNVVFISYQYTVSGTGRKNTVKNVPMGYAPVFKFDLYLPYLGKTLILTLPQCIGGKWALATKLDDFAVPEFDFEGFANDAGDVITWSTSE